MPDTHHTGHTWRQRLQQDGFFVRDAVELEKRCQPQTPEKELADELRRFGVLVYLFSEHTGEEHCERYGQNIQELIELTGQLMADVKELQKQHRAEHHPMLIKTSGKLACAKSKLDGGLHRHKIFAGRNDTQAATRRADYLFDALKPLAEQLRALSYEIEMLPEPEKPEQQAAYRIEKTPDVWTFYFRDEEVSVNAKLKGLKAIEFLLKHPHKTFGCSDILEAIGEKKHWRQSRY